MDRSVYEGSGRALRLEAPFIDKNKAQVVAEGLKLDVPYELTWSCYQGGERPCGICGPVSTAVWRSKRTESKIRRIRTIIFKRN